MKTTKYPPSFFSQYRKYLESPEVKRQHRRVFEAFRAMAELELSRWSVVDLGCGTCEFGRYVMDQGLGSYVGVDLDLSNADHSVAIALIEGDYNNLSAQDNAFVSTSNVFVSLFSTEVHCSFKERYALYERLFQNGMEAALVAGFVYNAHPNEAEVMENFGESHYQSVEPLRLITSSFEEIRLECKVPAGMFESEFVEVWKILLRRK